MNPVYPFPPNNITVHSESSSATISQSSRLSLAINNPYIYPTFFIYIEKNMIEESMTWNFLLVIITNMHTKQYISSLQCVCVYIYITRSIVITRERKGGGRRRRRLRGVGDKGKVVSPPICKQMEVTFNRAPNTSHWRRRRQRERERKKKTTIDSFLARTTGKIELKIRRIQW